MAGQRTKIISFDNFAFAVAAGDFEDLADHAIGLVAYGRRQRERPDHNPTFYYLDVALFPARFDRLYEEFRQSIAELNA